MGSLSGVASMGSLSGVASIDLWQSTPNEFSRTLRLVLLAGTYSSELVSGYFFV